MKEKTDRWFGVIRGVPLACADDGAALAFFERLRWGDDACCPRCGNMDVYKMRDKATGKRQKQMLWRCRGCSKKYSVRTDTVMEHSRIPLRFWAHALWRMGASKKGVAAKQIERETGLSYKTAHFLLHRIRKAMDMDLKFRLQGTVEVDEVWIGGRPRFRGTGKRGRGTKKQPVLTMVERGGRVKTQAVTDVGAKTLQGTIGKTVERTATMMTDENPSYRGLGRRYNGHGVVCHRAKEYVNGIKHNNTAESVHAIIKRSIYGVYHSVSKKHLHRYLAEYDFRWNTRKMSDGERLRTLVLSMQAKRLSGSFRQEYPGYCR